MKVGDVLSLSTSRCLWEVVAIEPWGTTQTGEPMEGDFASLRHATAEDQAEWPGFIDREGVKTLKAVATVCVVEEHIGGERWAVLPEETPVECDAARPDGTGLVLLNRVLD